MLQVRLTVYFEDPFWVGVFEMRDGVTLRAARIVFGAEPKDYDVYDFIVNKYSRLRYGLPVSSLEKTGKHCLLKRAQRAAKRLVEEKGIGTKAQQALKLQHEQGAKERKERSKQQKEIETQQKYELRRQKQKEKHRGR